MAIHLTVQEWVTRFNFPQKPFSRKDVRQILRGWQDDRVELQQQNAELVKALEVFFKVVVVDEQDYRPGLPLCAGCPHLTIARGWECFYKPHTTECKYPDLLQKAALAQVKEE